MAAATGTAGGGEQYQGLQQVSPTTPGMQPEMPMTGPGVGMPMYADPAFMAQQAARGQSMGVPPGMYGVAGAIPTPYPMSGQQPIRLAMTPTPESRFDQYDRELEAMRVRIEELERKIASSDGGRERKRLPMKDRKAYLSQAEFIGTPKEFEKWVFGFRDLLRQESGFEEYFTWAHKELKLPTAAAVDTASRVLMVASEDIAWFDEQL